MNTPTDILGFPIKVHDTVVRAERHGSNSPFLRFCLVTGVHNGMVYLNHSKTPLKYPDRVLIYRSAEKD